MRSRRRNDFDATQNAHAHRIASSVSRRFDAGHVTIASSANTRTEGYFT
jgi:hypothetical protein